MLIETLLPEELLDLRSNNPYSVGELFLFPEGDYLLDRKPIEVDKSINDRYYTVLQGDTIGKIAFIAYGDSKEWWVITDVNNIAWPFELEIGKTLIIPDLDKVKISIV